MELYHTTKKHLKGIIAQFKKCPTSERNGAKNVLPEGVSVEAPHLLLSATENPGHLWNNLQLEKILLDFPSLVRLTLVHWSCGHLGFIKAF